MVSAWLRFEKIRHEIDLATGKISLKKVVKIQIINETKRIYNQMKKSYKKGDLKL